MTKAEKINRNIGLTFDFLRQVIKDPKITAKIPDGAILEFVEKDFAQIEKASWKIQTKASKRKFLRVKSHLEVI